MHGDDYISLKMSAKDKVFDAVNLFHELLNFLDGAIPLTLACISKTWNQMLYNYQFPNLLFNPNNINHVKLKPRKLLIMKKFPDEIYPYSVRKILCLSSSKILSSMNSLNSFCNILDLEVDIKCIKIMHQIKCFPVSLKRLTIFQDILDSISRIEFSGMKFENLKTLDITSFANLEYEPLILPPSLTALHGPRSWKTLPKPGYFPATIKHLSLNCNDNILPEHLPPNIECLEANFGVLKTIPFSLISLHIGEYCSAPILQGNERRLRTLVLGSTSVQHATSYNFHSITTLKINNKDKFNVYDLPPTLTTLEMNVSEFIPFDSADLPYSLLSLCLKVHNCYPRFFKLPPRLRSLELINDDGNTDLIPNDFPDSLTALRIYYRSMKISHQSLPENLRDLYISSHSLSIKPGSLPDSLRSLSIPWQNKPFARNILPTGLNFLEVGRFFPGLNSSWFPLNLEYICMKKKNIKAPRKTKVKVIITVKTEIVVTLKILFGSNESILIS